MNRASLIVIVATISFVVAISSVSAIHVFGQGAETINTFSQQFSTGCKPKSGSECCTGAASCYSSSSLTLTNSSIPVKFPFNLSFSLSCSFSSACNCNAMRCHCFGSGSSGQIVDLTNVARANAGKTLKIAGTYSWNPFSASCKNEFHINIIKPNRGAMKNESQIFFPYPFDKNCESNSSSGACSDQTVMREFSCQGGAAATTGRCNKQIIIPKDLKQYGNALLVSLSPPRDCYYNYCVYGGSGSGYATATIDLV